MTGGESELSPPTDLETRHTSPIHRVRGLLDHFVGGRDKIGRERKPERMGCTKIDNEIKFRRYVDRKIAGVSAAKDAIDVAGS
jgi:hypothetical protein